MHQTTVNDGNGQLLVQLRKNAFFVVCGGAEVQEIPASLIEAYRSSVQKEDRGLIVIHQTPHITIALAIPHHITSLYYSSFHPFQCVTYQLDNLIKSLHYLNTSPHTTLRSTET